ncbi:hypothetical protein B0H17DRAFT_1151714 [Mycena rosella]|uniref:Uncharacterized protein n=1 Tax=Mycena rosella TaxID=1033263 RepID=A0AAD7BI08_MYCRO|nr:hypothetical protein B0H17DRAFT_1151714 [Mycena rosella]
MRRGVPGERGGTLGTFLRGLCGLFIDIAARGENSSALADDSQNGNPTDQFLLIPFAVHWPIFTGFNYLFESSIIYPHSAEGYFKGKSKLPQAICFQRIHKITCITPGAIVTAATLVHLILLQHGAAQASQAIWLFSADTQLVQVGDKTTIDYAA